MLVFKLHDLRVYIVSTYFLIIFPAGSKLLFLTLRQQTVTAQSVLFADDVKISKQMLKFATGFVATYDANALMP